MPTTRAPTVFLKKKDATDDVGLAAGGKKVFDVGKDKSWTVSWNNSKGKEVETDTTNMGVGITAQQLVMFDSNFGGDYDIQYNFAAVALSRVSGHPL